MNREKLRVDLAGIPLESPLVAASGPFGYAREYSRTLDCCEFGAITCKGVSLEPWPGNPPPRLAETAAGMLNAIGLQNPGLDRFLAEELPFLRELGPRLIVNIVGRTVEEYAAVAAGLEGVAGVDGLEVNISCPNIKAGGLAFGLDPRMTESVVSAVRRQTTLPLFVKLSPNVTDIVVIARAAAAGGADALSLVNTLAGMLIDVETCRPILANTFGGLSGPAILPVALKMVWQVAGAVDLPLLGMGGINSSADSLQFLMAGARAVALGTGLFYDPGLPARINRELCAFLDRRGLDRIGQLEGAALPRERKE